MNEYFSYQTQPSILLFPCTKLLFKKNDMATYKKSEITIVLHQIQFIYLSHSVNRCVTDASYDEYGFFHEYSF